MTKCKQCLKDADCVDVIGEALEGEELCQECLDDYCQGEDYGVYHE